MIGAAMLAALLSDRKTQPVTGLSMRAENFHRTTEATQMTVRTTSKTVTLRHPFNLSGTDEAQPAGTYTVETDEELLPTTLPAYRRISTLLRLPADATTGTELTQMVEINPAELEAIVAGDAERGKAIRQAVLEEPVVRRQNPTSWIEFIRRGWSRWLTLNANSLAWTALVVGNILFTTWLMKG
jgi:hypothetical protein